MVYMVTPSGKTKPLHIHSTRNGLVDAIGCTSLGYVRLNQNVFRGMRAYVDGKGDYNNLEINDMISQYHKSYHGNILFSRVDLNGHEIGVTAMDMHLLDQLFNKM